eukprot:CAMPEP_0201542488 /NCGR_PEP_ID=MMETSP0161_2-20130828/72067_1 /ASSEMBLY_ACC=CAM_ASM_000251 /TAXON_ID=180227 /ORGANISM="Neoparamoeba aestuarina, Strain SoJaBio B1-5/56/2" /LENGTH=287 /DNA_ID=CAMNT_0047950149 /DNA_START=459 /DNA_END=1319 /DNA_ORIENTATION=-
MDEWGFTSHAAETAVGKNPLVIGSCTGTPLGTPHSSAPLSSLSSSLSSLSPSLSSNLTAALSSTASFTPSTSCATVTIYGHYDVVPGDGEWESPPFEMEGRDGYLYGRGVTDNKGPILAALFAVKEMKEQGKLNVNVNFVIEGEEECDSAGFQTAIHNNKHLLADTDLLLFSNEQWLAEETPCLVFGMRGIIQIEVEIIGAKVDLHSGIDGGVLNEPLVDLIHLLSGLVQGDGKVLVPDFYDDVEGVTDDEKEIYEKVGFDVRGYGKKIGVSSFLTSDPLYFLMRRW